MIGWMLWRIVLPWNFFICKYRFFFFIKINRNFLGLLVCNTFIKTNIFAYFNTTLFLDVDFICFWWGAISNKNTFRTYRVQLITFVLGNMNVYRTSKTLKVIKIQLEFFFRVHVIKNSVRTFILYVDYRHKRFSP